MNYLWLGPVEIGIITYLMYREVSYLRYLLLNIRVVYPCRKYI